LGQRAPTSEQKMRHAGRLRAVSSVSAVMAVFLTVVVTALPTPDSVQSADIFHQHNEKYICG
jgi:uncharacterized membrane protein